MFYTQKTTCNRKISQNDFFHLIFRKFEITDLQPFFSLLIIDRACGLHPTITVGDSQLWELPPKGKKINQARKYTKTFPCLFRGKYFFRPEYAHAIIFSGCIRIVLSKNSIKSNVQLKSYGNIFPRNFSFWHCLICWLWLKWQKPRVWRYYWSPKMLIYGCWNTV